MQYYRATSSVLATVCSICEEHRVSGHNYNTKQWTMFTLVINDYHKFLTQQNGQRLHDYHKFGNVK